MTDSYVRRDSFILSHDSFIREVVSHDSHNGVALEIRLFFWSSFWSGIAHSYAFICETCEIDIFASLMCGTCVIHMFASFICERHDSYVCFIHINVRDMTHICIYTMTDSIHMCDIHMCNIHM